MKKLFRKNGYTKPLKILKKYSIEKAFLKKFFKENGPIKKLFIEKFSIENGLIGKLLIENSLAEKFSLQQALKVLLESFVLQKAFGTAFFCKMLLWKTPLNYFT